MKRPADVLVSIPWSNAIRSTPSPSSSPATLTRCRTLLAKRSSRQTATACGPKRPGWEDGTCPLQSTSTLTRRSAQRTNRTAPRSRNPTPHEYEDDARIQESVATREKSILTSSLMGGETNPLLADFSATDNGGFGKTGTAVVRG